MTMGVSGAYDIYIYIYIYIYTCIYIYIFICTPTTEIPQPDPMNPMFQSALKNAFSFKTPVEIPGDHSEIDQMPDPQMLQEQGWVNWE